MQAELQYTLRLDVQLSQELDFGDEGHGFASEFVSTLTLYDEAIDQDVIVGKLSGYIFDFGAVESYTDRKCDFSWLLDLKPEYREYQPLYDLYGGFADDVRPILSEHELGCNTLIMHRLAIHPSYRSRGLGEALVRSTIRRLGPTFKLIALKVQSLLTADALEPFGDFSNVLISDKYPIPNETLAKYLRRYFESLGFVALASHPDLMVLNPYAETRVT